MNSNNETLECVILEEFSTSCQVAEVLRATICNPVLHPPYTEHRTGKIGKVIKSEQGKNAKQTNVNMQKNNILSEKRNRIEKVPFSKHKN